MIACIEGSTDIAKLLLGAGASVHAAERVGSCTPCVRGHVEQVKLLIDCGASSETVIPNGGRPRAREVTRRLRSS